MNAPKSTDDLMQEARRVMQLELGRRQSPGDSLYPTSARAIEALRDSVRSMLHHLEQTEAAVDDEREALDRAVREVTWNASNYPRKAQPHILGADIGPLTAKIIAAVMPLVNHVRAQAFEAGWRASGEGYNGEWPDEGVPWEKAAGRDAYELWIESEGAGA